MIQVPYFASRLASLLRWNGGRGGRLCILIYHQVLRRSEAAWEDEPDQERFRSEMELIARHCHALPLSEAVTRMYEDSLPPRAVSITFDDGYLNNYEVAFPILRDLGLPATVFVSTSFIDGGCPWNDQIILGIHGYPADHLDLTSMGFGIHSLTNERERRNTVDILLKKIKYMPLAQRRETLETLLDICKFTPPENLMMTSGQLRELCANGIEIGGHTITHPILRCEDVNVARREICEGKRQLEEIIERPVSSFAYPNGRPGVDLTQRDVDLVRECGFERAVTTFCGAASKLDDRLLLPRFHPWDRSLKNFLARMAAETLQYNDVRHALARGEYGHD